MFGLDRRPSLAQNRSWRGKPFPPQVTQTLEGLTRNDNQINPASKPSQVLAMPYDDWPDKPITAKRYVPSLLESQWWETVRRGESSRNAGDNL